MLKKKKEEESDSEDEDFEILKPISEEDEAVLGQYKKRKHKKKDNSLEKNLDKIERRKNNSEKEKSKSDYNPKMDYDGDGVVSAAELSYYNEINGVYTEHELTPKELAMQEMREAEIKKRVDEDFEIIETLTFDDYMLGKSSGGWNRGKKKKRVDDEE